MIAAIGISFLAGLCLGMASVILYFARKKNKQDGGIIFLSDSEDNFQGGGAE